MTQTDANLVGIDIASLSLSLSLLYHATSAFYANTDPAGRGGGGERKRRRR
jgi:hypothetical protein